MPFIAQKIKPEALVFNILASCFKVFVAQLIPNAESLPQQRGVTSIDLKTDYKT
jgi:hypothetical protein